MGRCFPPWPTVHRPDGFVVTIRSADPRPKAHVRTLRVRVPAGDLPARRYAPVELLWATDPARRQAGRQARRARRSHERRTTNRRRTPGHRVHPDHHRRSRPRDSEPWPVAQAAPRTVRLAGSGSVPPPVSSSVSRSPSSASTSDSPTNSPYRSCCQPRLSTRRP